MGDVKREGDQQNRSGEEKRLPPVGELFQVPKLWFWGKNTWNFFLFFTIARVLFYECSPYLDGSAIDFIALTMIDPALSWFEKVELPLVI